MTAGLDPIALERQGLAAKSAGRLTEAIAIFVQLTRLTPQAHGAFYNLGNAYLAADRHAEAVDAYRRAVKLAPRFAHAHNNLGVTLLAMGQVPLAAGSFARAAALDPQNPGAQHLAGHTLLQMGRPEEALFYLRAANALAPQQAVIMTDLGDALRRTGAYDEVAPLAREAARLVPGRIEAWNNLANAERDLYAFGAAEAASRHALTLAPDDAEVHYNLAMTLLAAGRWEEAWPHWEYRWDAVPGAKRRFPGPRWDGTPLPGRTLYLHAEQGQGDTIQFCRYAMLAADRAEVVLGVQPTLVRLLQSLPRVRVVSELDTPPVFAAQAPLVSLPEAFGTDAANIPAPVPYLVPEPDLAVAWAARLATLPGRRVGLVWAGNRDFPFDFARSIKPALLNALAGVPDVSFVSLQVGAGDRPVLALADWTAELRDFADTAALISGLDLVIGVDTAVTHLAGALGRPTWLLNRWAGDWRWGAVGETSLWYPTMRQFRQPKPGDWTTPITHIRQALESKAGCAVPAPPDPPSSVE
jgi:tetratricopeptide (TPR) repeat protein